MAQGDVAAGDVEGEREEEDDEWEMEQVLQELFLGETAYLQEQGELQGTLVIAADGHTPKSAGTPSHTAGTLSLAAEYGFTPWFQLEVELPFRSVFMEGSNNAGVGRIEAGALFGGVIRASPEIALAGGLEVAFPPVTGGLDEEAYGIEPIIIFHVKLGPVRLVLNGGVEAEIPTDSTQQVEWSGSGTIALFFPLGPVVPTIEFQVEGGEESSFRAGVGLVWPVVEALQFGISAYGGTTSSGPIYGGSLVVVAEYNFLESEDE